MSEDYRIICSDLDRTLLNAKKQVGDEDRRWIKKVCDEKGVLFACATGRMYESARYYSDLIGVRGPAICYNGGYICGVDGTVLDDYRMPQDIMDGLIREFRAEGWKMIMFSGADWFTEETESLCYRSRANCYKTPAFVVDDLRRVNEKRASNKIIIADENRDNLIRVMDRLQANGYPEGLVHYYPGPYYLEIMNAGCNKGRGIEALSKAMGIDKSRIIAFGDDYNDVEMLETAGLGIAMGNSFPGVAEHAKMVTDTNENCGIAKAIQKIFY